MPLFGLLLHGVTAGRTTWWRAEKNLDVERVTAFLRGNRWNLGGLVENCPVPVHLLAATEPGTALREPAAALRASAR